MPVKTTLQRGLKNGLDTFWILAKVILPVYILLPLLRLTPLLSFIEDLGRPFLLFIGLPGEAALALVTGYFVNFYSAIAVISTLSLTPCEITVLGTMLVIAHALLEEGVILKKFKLQLSLFMAFRILLSLLAGYIVATIIL